MGGKCVRNAHKWWRELMGAYISHVDAAPNGVMLAQGFGNFAVLRVGDVDR